MGYSEYHGSTGDGVRLYARQWLNAKDAKGLVYIIHGIGEHSGRYESLAETLVNEGFNVIVPDLRGHGKSGGRRGHYPSYDSIMEDIDMFMGSSDASAFGQLPRFLYGHSMGGNIVLNYVLRRKPEIAGVVASAPWLKLAFDVPPYKIKMGKIINRIWPSFTEANGLDLEALSRDRESVERYKQDPLVHDRISARLFLSIEEAGLWALEHAPELDIPLLIMHGSGDRITSCKASELFAERAKEVSTLMIWKGFFHEIHNEPFKEEMISYLLSWLKMTADSSSSAQQITL